VILRRRELREIGRLDACLGVSRELDSKRFAEELSGELRSIAKELKEDLVRDGRHTIASVAFARSCSRFDVPADVRVPSALLLKLADRGHPGALLVDGLPVATD